MPWQDRALRVVDLIPELDYVSRFHARLLTQLRLYPAKRGQDGELTEITSGPPVDILNRIRDSGGGHAQLLSAFGRLDFITGEGNLFGYDLNTPQEAWRYVWNEELDVELNSDDTIKKITWRPNSSGSPREFTGEQAVVYKFWTSHPRRTGEATSPMRAIVEGNLAEELIQLGQSVRSQAVSRTGRGILIIPQEISPPPADIEGDEDPESSPWIISIAEHLEAQNEQAGSAAAAAPYLMEVPFEYAEGIRMVQLHDPQHDYLEKELRNELVIRIARGVDFPAEALTGIGETNHWAALQILMDMWRSHGAPKAQQFVGDMTVVYFQPALEAEEYPDWENTVVAYDASAVTVKPDRSDDAKTALQLKAIGPKGFRAMLDIPDEYAPTPEELEQMQGPEPRQRQEEDQTSDPADGPDQPGPEGDSGRRTRMTASANGNGHTDVVALALMRCRELAGIRIKQKTTRQFPERLEFIQTIPFSDLAAVLGFETLREMGITDAIALVSGGADNLRSLLKVRGYSKEQADIFGKQVEMHAADTLYDLQFPDDDDVFTALVGRLGIAA